MLAALDVHYDETARAARAAAVVFRQPEDDEPIAEYRARCLRVEPYVPGEFFKRELPCLLAVLEKIKEPLGLIIIDGYVSLGDRPGLGMHLWEALHRSTPIIGVGKTRFHSAPSIEIARGQSQAPLFVTAVGIEPAAAGESIREMHGPFRIPTLLKRADRLARA